MTADFLKSFGKCTLHRWIHVKGSCQRKILYQNRIHGSSSMNFVTFSQFALNFTAAPISHVPDIVCDFCEKKTDHSNICTLYECIQNLQKYSTKLFHRLLVARQLWAVWKSREFSFPRTVHPTSKEYKICKPYILHRWHIHISTDHDKNCVSW